MAVTHLYIFSLFKFQILFSTIGMAHYVELILLPSTLTLHSLCCSVFPEKSVHIYDCENQKISSVFKIMDT